MLSEKEASDELRKQFCEDIVPVTKFSYKLGGKARTEIQLNIEEFSKKREKFLAEAPSVTPKESLEKTSDLLKEPFIVGESHTHISPKKFLIENMKKMKENGYEILFMEHLFYDTHQKDLDHFFETGEISNELMTQLQAMNRHGLVHLFDHSSEAIPDLWKKNDYIAVLQAAREAGIRIVGIDVSPVYKSQKIGMNSEQMDSTRIGYMNYTAANIMQREIHSLPPGKKWCAFMGNAHVNSFENTPGVSELLNARSVYIFDPPQWKTSQKPNEGSIELDSEYIIMNGRRIFKGDAIFELDPRSNASSLLEKPSENTCSITSSYKEKLEHIQSPESKLTAKKELAIKYLSNLEVAQIGEIFGFDDGELDDTYHFVKRITPANSNKPFEENNTFALVIESYYSDREPYTLYISKDQLLEFAAEQNKIDLKQEDENQLNI